MDNLYVGEPVTKTKRRPNKWLRRLRKNIIYLCIAFLLLAGILAWVTTTSNSSPVLDFLNPANKIEDDRGRINFLLLGIAGGTHDGPNLTDSIIVASYNTKDDSVDLISLPRDLWVDSQKAKVNTLYQTGLEKGDGLNFAETEVGAILGIKIPYGIRVDFSAFTKAVDQVGGLDINVERTFDDFAYPIPGNETDMCGKTEKEVDIPDDQAKILGVDPGKHIALLNPDNSIATTSAQVNQPISYSDDNVAELFPCRYEHLHFDKGLTHMDGITALKYVRSRHGTGIEGSDFARSRRQQLVLEAFRNKVLSLNTLTDPSKVGGLLSTFGKSIDLDIPTTRFVQLLDMIKKAKNIRSHVLDGSGNPPVLIHPDLGGYGGAWVLVPPKNDYKILGSYVNGFLYPESTLSATPKK